MVNIISGTRARRAHLRASVSLWFYISRIHMSHDSDSPSPPGYQFDASEALQEHSSDVSSRGVAAPRPRRSPAFVEQFPAIIRSSPCASNGTADYTDARYYLDRAVPAADLSATSLLSAEAGTLPGVRQCLTATNLAELAGGTHLLPAGMVVQVFALYTRPGRKLYVFNQPPPDGAVVKITGAAAGGGKYNGRILSGASTAVVSGNVAMPEGMGVPSADEALIVNEEEDGQSGHRLSIPCFAVGRIAGTSAGLTVVMIRGALGATSSPTVLG
ncbi:MAG: hypothetical protein ACREJM_05120, partial [Candidatus Saccharimonadales bacterium]